MMGFSFSRVVTIRFALKIKLRVYSEDEGVKILERLKRREILLRLDTRRIKRKRG